MVGKAWNAVGVFAKRYVGVPTRDRGGGVHARGSPEQRRPAAWNLVNRKCLYDISALTHECALGKPYVLIQSNDFIVT